MRPGKIIRWNLVLLVIICLYGFFTDEPYWRDVGHGPWLYDYFFWFALALNGPSGFLADYLSWLTKTQPETRYLIQYALWCLLLWPQWRLYGRLARWSLESPGRRAAVYAFASSVVVVGAAAAYKAWLFGHRPSDLFIDRYFWFVRIAGLACSGIVILLYSYIAADQTRVNRIEQAAEFLTMPIRSAGAYVARQFKAYVLLSIILPVILFIPWAMSWNVLGEGVQAGTAGFLPDVLYPYTAWYPGPPETEAVDPILKSFVITTARIIIILFPASLVNLLIILPFTSIKRTMLKRRALSNASLDQ